MVLRASLQHCTGKRAGQAHKDPFQLVGVRLASNNMISRRRRGRWEMGDYFRGSVDGAWRRVGVVVGVWVDGVELHVVSGQWVWTPFAAVI